MTAGRGIVHSEMPKVTEGDLWGFQLWINLPARAKMQPAAYRDIPAQEIPALGLDGGGVARVIRGTLHQQGGSATGPAAGDSAATLYADLQLPPAAVFAAQVAPQDNVMVYLYEGAVAVGEPGTPLPASAAGVLSPGERIALRAGPVGARLLLLAGTPIGEPVVQYGPFVMNTRAQIEQAIDDYQAGRLGVG